MQVKEEERKKNRAMMDGVIKFEDMSYILLPTNLTAKAFMTDRYSDEGGHHCKRSGRSLILHQHKTLVNCRSTILFLIFLFMICGIMVFCGPPVP
ncbi:unnamed protein product [Onchocerca flexuosa]|uniref:Transmembrane protein n=1 Tax=Onchocerca flexuosa TaxID=387005 RepID=A0A183HYF1_9BILA|nr:unnamed protein product [Onchocerca flexuosa]